MNLPPNHIGLPFQTPWTVRQPYVFRYLEQKFVDSFFNDGSLRISSFKQFASHRDEARFDGEEGSALVMHQNIEADQSCGAMITSGYSSFVFCGATKFSKSIADQFGTDSGFRINDTLAFAQVVSRHIPGFMGGTQGPCIYLPQRIVMRDLGTDDIMDRIRDDDDPSRTSLKKMMDLNLQLGGDDQMFVKKAEYVSQAEYRFAWHSNIEPFPAFIDIRVPEARQFCTRFSSIENERLP